MDAIGSVQQELGGKHRHVGADHQQLQRISRRMHSTGCGQIDRQLVAQDGDPAQRQPQRLALTIATDQRARHDFQRVEVDIWLVEAVEQQLRTSRTSSTAASSTWAPARRGSVGTK